MGSTYCTRSTIVVKLESCATSNSRILPHLIPFQMLDCWHLMARAKAQRTFGIGVCSVLINQRFTVPKPKVCHRPKPVGAPWKCAIALSLSRTNTSAPLSLSRSFSQRTHQYLSLPPSLPLSLSLSLSVSLSQVWEQRSTPKGPFFLHAHSHNSLTRCGSIGIPKRLSTSPHENSAQVIFLFLFFAGVGAEAP
jgi:hypothetical protein